MELHYIMVPLLVLLSLIENVDSLKCYKCNSTLDHNCQEFFNNDNPNIPLKPVDCGMYNAKYCIKVTGLWGGIVGTHRFCSSRDLGDQCQDMRFPDHSRKYRGCIYTCSSDGCNAALSIFSTSTTAVSVLVSVLLMVLFQRWSVCDWHCLCIYVIGMQWNCMCHCRGCVWYQSNTMFF